MEARIGKRWPWVFGLLLLGGCLDPVREQADRAVCDKAAHAIDLQPLSQPDESTRMPPASARDSGTSDGITRTSYQPQGAGEQAPGATLLNRLRLPPDIPGANAPPIRLPGSEKER